MVNCMHALWYAVDQGSSPCNFFTNSVILGKLLHFTSLLQNKTKTVHIFSVCFYKYSKPSNIMYYNNNSSPELL